MFRRFLRAMTSTRAPSCPQGRPGSWTQFLDGENEYTYRHGGVDVEAYVAGAREVGMSAILYRDNVQAKASIESLLAG